VAIGVVVQQPIGHPQHALTAEGLQHRAGERSLVHRRVAVGVEQALARAEHGALAVHLDAPALHREVVGDRPAARGMGHLRAHLGVVRELKLPAPAVEAEARGDHRAGHVVHEHGRGVAEPDVAEGDAVERRVEPGARRRPARRPWRTR
jgi:hypothetical protein